MINTNIVNESAHNLLINSTHLDNKTGGSCGYIQHTLSLTNVWAHSICGCSLFVSPQNLPFAESHCPTANNPEGDEHNHKTGARTDCH